MYNDDQPRDEQGRWTNGGSGSGREELSDALKRLSEATNPNRGHKVNRVELPKKEYAEVCSAVRTKYANKIPAKGQMLYGENYYQFKYSRRNEQIVCTLKLTIKGNEQLINDIMEDF